MDLGLYKIHIKIFCVMDSISMFVCIGACVHSCACMCLVIPIYVTMQFLQCLFLGLAHSVDSSTQRATLPNRPGVQSSLGRDWRRRPGRPRARWTDQLRIDTGSVPANL